MSEGVQLEYVAPRPWGAARPHLGTSSFPKASLGPWATLPMTLEPVIVSQFMFFLPGECVPV